MTDRRLPASYWFARAVVLLATFGAVYLLWTVLVVHWLDAADSWIAEVARWADRANPLL